MSSVDPSSYPYKSAMAVAVGASKPQRPGYGPGYVPPPFPGAPPIPHGVVVNPQQWQNGQWHYNPAYRPPNRSSAPAQPHVPWIPGQAWQQHIQPAPSASSTSASYGPTPPSASSQNSAASSAASAAAAAAAHAAANQQVRAAHSAQAAQAAASYNPFKRPIPPPSAEYLAQPLINNPLGLWEVSKGEKPSMATTTPWIWNPAKLRPDKDDDDTDEDEDDAGDYMAEDDDDMMSSTTVVASPDPGHKDKDKDYTTRSVLRPTFSPSIIRTPSYYQQHPGVAPNPTHPSSHPPQTQATYNPNPNNPLQRTATMPVPPLPLGSLGSISNSSMGSLSSSASSFSSMGSLSSASSYTAIPSPTSARGFPGPGQGQLQIHSKPSLPRFLDAQQHVLSEEPEGIEGILSPLTLFDSAPLPSFTNPFPGPEQTRDPRHDHKPPRPSGLGRASYTPPDAEPPPPARAYPATYVPAYPQPGSGSFDDHDLHEHIDAASGGGRRERKDDYRERRDDYRDRDKDKERAEQKEAGRRAKRESERRLKTTRDADRAHKAHMHTTSLQPPVSQRSVEDSSTQPSSETGAREGTPTPSQQQAAQYAQARAQQERRQQEYKYYRALERSRSGEGDNAEAERSINGDQAERERDRDGGRTGGGRGLRGEPTLEDISVPVHVSPPTAGRLPDSAMGLSTALRQGSSSGDLSRQGSHTRESLEGSAHTSRWTSWRGEQRGPPPPSASALASSSSSSSSSSTSSTGTVTGAAPAAVTIHVTGPADANNANNATAPKPFPPPQPLPRRGSVTSSSLPSISHAHAHLGGAGTGTPTSAARIVDRRELGLGSRHTLATYAPSPAPAAHQHHQQHQQYSQNQDSPSANRAPGSRETSHDSLGVPAPVAAGVTPARKQRSTGSGPAALTNLPKPWSETPVRTPERNNSGSSGRSRGASFASPAPSPLHDDGGYPYGGGSVRRDSARERGRDQKEREVGRTQSTGNIDAGSSNSNTTTPTPSRFVSTHTTLGPQHNSHGPAGGGTQSHSGSGAGNNPLPAPPLPSPLPESIRSLQSLQRFAEILSPPSTPANLNNAHARTSQAQAHQRQTRSPSPRSRSRSRSTSTSRDVLDRTRRAAHVSSSPRTPPAHGHHPNSSAYFSPSGPQPHPPMPSSRSSTPRTSSSTATTTPPTVAPLAPVPTGPQPRRPASASSTKLHYHAHPHPYPPSSAAHAQGQAHSPSASVVSLSVGAGPWRRRVGYWNRRGDHLTAEGFLVFAPPDRAYPADLRTYPPEEEGYQDEFANFSEWAQRPELPASLPRYGREPEKPYDEFVTYCLVSSDAAATANS